MAGTRHTMQPLFVAALVILLLLAFFYFGAVSGGGGGRVEVEVVTPRTEAADQLTGGLKLCRRNAYLYGADEENVRHAIRERALWGTRGEDLKGSERWYNREARNVSNSWSFLGPVYPLCPTPLESFGRGDEEKRFCLPGFGIKGDESAETAQQKTTGWGNCRVLSIGGNNKWDFEVSMFERTPCAIHTFDCTVMNPTTPASIEKRTTFHPICIGSKTSTRIEERRNQTRKVQYMSLGDMINRSSSGGGRGHTIFKMDVEGYEWEVFQGMLLDAENASDLELPDQMYIEFHWGTQMKGLSWRGRAKSPLELFQLSQALFFKLGYIVTDKRPNTICPHCIEVLITRVLC